MKRAAKAMAVAAVFLAFPFLSVPQETSMQGAPARPHILGIAQVTVWTTHPHAAKEFYSDVLRIIRPTDCEPCDKILPTRYSVNHEQIVGVYPARSAPPNLIEEITFATDDIPALRRYLEFHKIAVTAAEKPDVAKPGNMPLTVIDPEGHRISFVERKKGVPAVTAETIDRQEIIHAGFVVKDRASEDTFYKDVLGFHVYWHGGMKDGTDDWVDMQVPDGTDWLEYMLNVPANADHHTLGVMDHMAIGVHDIHATYDGLVAAGMKLSEKPKIGRDGKWQLNLYDPDDTRVEFMERKPTDKPCCSAYQGPHPGESRMQATSPQ
jgi:catechol 2,3-dioxygenase-like lactoylglutathione lyase family enzyme/predicted enzyme related to lactoylglutathione lyase